MASVHMEKSAQNFDSNNAHHNGKAMRKEN